MNSNKHMSAMEAFQVCRDIFEAKLVRVGVLLLFIFYENFSYKKDQGVNGTSS